MFPAPSPNSQALFNSLQSGGATPSTLDFYRTSLGAKAATQGSSFAPTSQPTDPNLQQTMDRSQQQQQQQQQQPAQQQQQDQFNQQHADADAVNGLYMLAQANTGGMRNGNQFAVPNQSIQTNMPTMQSGSQSQDTSPVTKRNPKNSIGSMSMSGQTDGFSDSAASEQATKPTTRSRGKKAAGGKANNRRKAEDTPAKTPASKRAKANNGSSSSAVQDMMMSDDDDGQDQSEIIDTHPNGKKMTDEEKRKNFLERNRVAALKCRQRKKQWLANLQAKVELFSTENDALSQTVTQLREELVNLKTIMLAHKDCPISVQQGIAGPAMSMYLGADGSHQHANPYGMAIQNGMQSGMQMPMQQGSGPQGQATMQRS
jgi:ATF/CREB family transcription factor